MQIKGQDHQPYVGRERHKESAQTRIVLDGIVLINHLVFYLRQPQFRCNVGRQTEFGPAQIKRIVYRRQRLEELNTSREIIKSKTDMRLNHYATRYRGVDENTKWTEFRKRKTDAETAYATKGEFTFNSMEYNSNILVWKPAGQDGKFDSHPGSGYIRGVSVSAFSFASYYLNEVFVKQSKREKGLLDKKVKKAREGALSFVKGLSRKLRVSWKDMRAFLMDPSNAGLIQDLCRAGYKAFLLETTFGIPPVKKIIPTEKKSKIFPAYRGVFKKKLSNYNSKKPNPNLQSIRLRFRINDHAESNSSFKLGINIWAPKVGIELKGFDRVGSEGIIDLATQWYGAFSSFNLTKSEAAYQSDRSVVPAVLL